MHHGQSRGENTRKVCKQVNLPKTGEKICKSRGERIIFAKQGGKCTETAKIGGIRNLWSMTKKKEKRSSEILSDESQEIFREKVKLLKFFRKSETFSEIGGKSETGGKCIMVSEGGWTPLRGRAVKSPIFLWTS